MRKHQSKDVTHDGRRFRITVYDARVDVVELFEQSRGNHTFTQTADVEDETRHDVILDHDDLSTAQSYRRAVSHARRAKRYA